MKKDKNKVNKVEKIKVNKNYIRISIILLIVGIAGFFILYTIILNQSVVIQ